MRKLRTFFWSSIVGLAFASCAPKQADVVTFGICTDVHLPTMHDSEYRIRTFIDSMKATQPDFIIELDDFIIPKEQYAGYFATWNSFEGEKYHVIGIYYITLTSMAYHWLGDDYVHARYSDEVDKNFKWIKYTAPFKEPLWVVVEILSGGYIKIKGRESEWVGPSPWELGYPEQFKQYMRSAISDRYLKF